MVSTKRDDNAIVVGMGVSSVDGVTPVPITVDELTGRLRCQQATPADGSSASGASTRAQYDENGVTTIMGETDNAARTPTALSVSDTNGGLMVKAD